MNPPQQFRTLITRHVAGVRLAEVDCLLRNNKTGVLGYGANLDRPTRWPSYESCEVGNTVTITHIYDQHHRVTLAEEQGGITIRGETDARLDEHTSISLFLYELSQPKKMARAFYGMLKKSRQNRLDVPPVHAAASTQ